MSLRRCICNTFQALGIVVFCKEICLKLLRVRSLVGTVILWSLCYNHLVVDWWIMSQKAETFRNMTVFEVLMRKSGHVLSFFQIPYSIPQKQIRLETFPTIAVETVSLKWSCKRESINICPGFQDDTVLYNSN